MEQSLKNEGLLITLEGIDGCGKSLLSKNLKQKLIEENIPVILTKQPGGTSLGIKLRKILEEENSNICNISEYLLFAADRAQHINEIIKPELQKGKIVISDRMADSSLAYQGYGRDIDIQKIKDINNWAMQNITPDLILYIEIDIKTAQQRIFKRNETLTSFEKEKSNFWEKVIDGYEKIFKNKSNIIRLNGKLTPEELTKKAITQIFEKMNQ